jgi:hypothetical protein
VARNNGDDNNAFAPEFSGKRGYQVRGEIEAQCDHGLVIDVLRQALERGGLRSRRDRNHDLFVFGSNPLLFEAKTETSTTNLYTAVGQLLLHAATMDPLPRRVLVVPDAPTIPTARVLAQLGIEVLQYEWDAVVPIFSNFNRFLFRK